MDFLTFIPVLTLTALATTLTTLSTCAWTSTLSTAPEGTAPLTRTTAARFATSTLMRQGAMTASLG